MNSSIAERFPAAWNPNPPSVSAAVRLADGSVHPTACSLNTLLSICALAEPTTFTVYYVGCGADVILGYNWIHSHQLDFCYEAAEQHITFCAERGCCSGRRVRADVALPSTQPTSGSALLSPKEARRLLATVGLDTASPLANPMHWRRQPPGRPGAAAALARMAGDAFAMACLASLADADITLPDGTSLGLGTFAITQSDDPAALDPPDFAQLAEEFKDDFELPNGLPPDRGPEFTLRIDTGDEPMPLSLPLKRLTQASSTSAAAT